MFGGQILRVRLYDRVLTGKEIAAAATDRPAYVSREDLLAALTEDERSERDSQRAKIEHLERSLEELERRDPGNPWADLAHILFNQKEFIYLQ